MSDVLERCPFCGSQDIKFEVQQLKWGRCPDEDPTTHTVAVCIGCAAQGPAFGPLSYSGERAAIKYWNNRFKPLSPSTKE